MASGGTLSAFAANSQSRTHGVRGLVSRNDRVRLDLNKCIRVDESGNLNHRGGRPDVTEDFAVGFVSLSPPKDVGHVDAGSNDILGSPAQRFDCSNNDLKGSTGLIGERGLDRAVGLDTDTAGYRDRVAYAERGTAGSPRPLGGSPTTFLGLFDVL